jgi:hypothetical protein
MVVSATTAAAASSSSVATAARTGVGVVGRGRSIFPIYFGTAYRKCDGENEKKSSDNSYESSQCLPFFKDAHLFSPFGILFQAGYLFFRLIIDFPVCQSKLLYPGNAVGFPGFGRHTVLVPEPAFFSLDPELDPYPGLASRIPHKGFLTVIARLVRLHLVIAEIRSHPVRVDPFSSPSDRAAAAGWPGWADRRDC